MGLHEWFPPPRSAPSPSSSFSYSYILTLLRLPGLSFVTFCQRLSRTFFLCLLPYSPWLEQITNTFVYTYIPNILAHPYATMQYFECRFRLLIRRRCLKILILNSSVIRMFLVSPSALFFHIYSYRHFYFDINTFA